MWSEKRSQINSSFLQIERRLETAKTLRTSEQSNFIDETEKHLSILEDEIFNISLNRTNPAEIKDIEGWEDKRAALSIEILKLRKGVSKVKVEPSKFDNLVNEGNDLTLQAHIGNNLVSRGKAAIQNIGNVIREINKNIDDIEEEVILHREKLLSVKDKMESTQSMLDQSKKIAGNFAKMLYHDIAIKVLICVISIAIVSIFCTAMMMNTKKKTIDKEKMENINKESVDADYNQISEKDFYRLEVAQENKTGVTFARKSHLHQMRKGKDLERSKSADKVSI